MRNLIFVLTALIIGASAGAATKAPSASKSKKVAAAKAPKKKLTQDANFTGATVNGKYQVAGGAVSAVENEKTLDDIIGGRKDFKDRLKADLARSKSPKKESVE